MSMQNYRTGRLTLAGLLAAVILMLPVAPARADGAPDTAKQIVQTPLSDAPAYAKRALVIGIDGYQNVPKLTDCDNDAHRVAAFLRDKMGFTDVTVMTDDRATPDNLQPTYTHITRQFNLLLDNIVPNQTQIVVFYSGHGVRTQNSQNGDADWLVPLDADPSDISQTCYNYSRFKSMLDTVRPARALLIMDACRNILQGKAAVGGSGFGGASVPLGPQIAELLSCEPTQTSLEGDPADFSESVFTHFLLKGLGGDPDAVDPNVDAVTFDSLMKYVQGQVSAYAQTRLNSAQLPTGAATFGSMILASSLANTVNVTSVAGETTVTPPLPGGTTASPSIAQSPVLQQPAPSKPQSPSEKQQAANARLIAIWTDEEGKYDYDAAGRMTVDVVRDALDAGADVNARGSNGDTTLIAAVRAMNTDMVKMLIQAGADVNAKDNDGGTALMAALPIDTDMVKMLIQAGADVNAKDNDGGTALMIPANAGDDDAVNMLILAGADVNAKDNKGRTALNYAENPPQGVSNFAKVTTIAALKEAGATDTVDQAQTSAPTSPKPLSSVVSLQNLQSLGTALKMYLQDSNGKLPLLKGHDDIKAALLPYLPFDKAPAMLIDPGDGLPYAVNKLLSGRTVASFKNPSHIVFCFESRHAPDGTRGVLFLDGTAKRLTIDEWIRYERASGMIPE